MRLRGSSDKNVPVAPRTAPDDKPDSGTYINPTVSDAGVDTLAPVVEITSPTAAANPNDDSVITDSSVTVHCHATRATASTATKVDASKVAITLQDPRDASKSITAPITAGADDDFTAQFALGALPNGPLQFRCTAPDQATKVHVGSASLATYLDLGPTVKIVSPEDKKNYALNTPVAISFKVEPDPLSGDDNEAEIGDVKLRVSGVDTSFEKSADDPTVYQTSINFNDKGKFPVTPSSAQLVITATNKRSPKPGTRTAMLDIVIDGQGPTIQINSPKDQSIIHGTNRLEVSIMDPSGVASDKIKATVADKMIDDTWQTNGSVYSQTFDTGGYAQTLTQLTINVTASDTVGNKATARVTVFLDNQPPLVALDPPMIRELRTVNMNDYCSQPFYPTGDWAARDLEQVEDSVYFRALIEDQTNHSPGSNFDYFAGVNDNKVEIYLETDSAEPLLINTHQKSGSTYCDEVNLAVIAKPNPTLHKETLQPVTARGAAFWAAPMNAPMGLLCPYDPGGSNPNTSLCSLGSDMYRVVGSARRTNKPPAIYAWHPNDSSECTGVAWNVAQFMRDAQNNARHGWFCVAMRTEDTFAAGSGNVGISAPLRLCYGTLSGSGSSATCEGVAAPSCTDGCTIAESQRWPEGMLWDDLK